MPHIWSEQAVAQQIFLVPLLTQWPVPPALQSVSTLQSIPSPTGGLHRPPIQVKPAAHAAGLPAQLGAQPLPTHW